MYLSNFYSIKSNYNYNYFVTYIPSLIPHRKPQLTHEISIRNVNLKSLFYVLKLNKKFSIIYFSII